VCVCVSVSGVLFSVGVCVCVCDLLIFLPFPGAQIRHRVALASASLSRVYEVLGHSDAAFDAMCGGVRALGFESTGSVDGEVYKNRLSPRCSYDKTQITSWKLAG